MARTFKLTNDQPPASEFKIDYQSLLNEQQFQAATQFHGPVLCIAGAGSGKTRTLIYRVARMLESGIAPDSILLLTFTRKAAANMLERVAALVGAQGKAVAGGTYHSFSAITLRKYGHYIGLSPAFSIIDEADAGDILNFLRSELGFNRKESRFPQKKTISQMFSKANNLEKSLTEIISDYYPQFAEHSEDLGRLHDEFASYKLKNLLLDYDDLLIFLHRLLSTSAEARSAITLRYRYVMADEYQDTNGLQARITFLLAGEGRNVMVVGDDAQSIYSFRGARVANILEFPKVYPDCRIIRLEKNYRSTRQILDAANSLMESAEEGFKKNLTTDKTLGELPARVRCEDEQEQAMFVAARILELREQGVRLDNMAVLFRSSFHAYQLELELKRRNIPYVKWGGFKFLEAGHLKDIIAHLRVIQNPYDQVSWLRVLLLIEGIGTHSATDIFGHIRQAVNPYDLSAVKARAKALKGLQTLSRMLISASGQVSAPPARLLEMVADYYFPILKERFDDYPRRFKDIDQLAIIAGRFASLSDFLTDLALEPPKNSVDEALAAEQSEDESLVLSTIHSAKGLEWHSVFVIHALEGRFPSFNSLKSEADLEEERRLMYVAVTRAAENLTISYPSQIWDPATGSLLARPSRFIEEIRQELLETWQISRQ
ncbi:MAG: ATP-dependent helicase [Candidatus Riflebacteria bacterium HGW-Riflebacteria-1]|jgi:DNA helicase-2/ATP-dependent DNA helicase PcrA|nr:MAG: ATP-dependent helicase [Candidatus Riflebacteria bacterium HGW-Riflebacteria-1]